MSYFCKVQHKKELQYLWRKDALATDLLLGLLDNAMSAATVGDQLWNGLLDATQIDEDQLHEEIRRLEHRPNHSLADIAKLLGR
jgi:hypothetical protein